LRKRGISKRHAIIVMVTLSLVLSFSLGVYASSTLKKVTAYQNSTIKVTVNGEAIDLGSGSTALYPLVYNGNTYVSAKALAEAMGGTVKWNSKTQTVEVTVGSVGNQDSAGVPYKDNSDSSPEEKPRSSGVFSFPANANLNTVLKENKELALEFAKAFASDVVAGKADKTKTMINRYVADEDAKNYFDGKADNINDINNSIDSYRINDKESLKKWQQAVEKATLSDLQISDASYVESYTGTLSYQLDLDEFLGPGSTVIVKFYVNKLNDRFVLESLLIY